MCLFHKNLTFLIPVELFYQTTLNCNESIEDGIPFDFDTCQEYWDSVSDSMRDLSWETIYLLFLLIGFSMVGFVMMYVGFGTATERINKRVRDTTFIALIRQEVSWYDVRSVAEITSQLADDAAMIHSFSGEPIRTFMMTAASVGCGLVVSFVFMWEVSLKAIIMSACEMVRYLILCCSVRLCRLGYLAIHGVWRVHAECANVRGR